MGIDQFHTLFRQLYNKPLGGYLSPEEIDNYLEMGTWEFMNDRIGNPEQYVPGRAITNKGYSISQKVRDELSTLETPGSISFTSGTGLLPANYFYLIELHLPQPRSFDPYAGASTNVDIIDRAAFSFRLQDQLLLVSEDYPIACQFGDNVSIAPDTITTADISYLRLPNKAKWNYTVVGGRPVYDPTGSVEIDLKESTHNNLLMRTLILAGMQLKDSEMFTLASQEEGRQ